MAISVAAGQRITSAWLQQLVPQPWQSITTLNGWTVIAGGVFAARLFNAVTVEINGAPLGAGTLSSGTVIGTMPSGMIPPVLHSLTGGASSSSAFLQDVQINIDTNGNIKYYGPTSGVANISFCGFISLDV